MSKPPTPTENSSVDLTNENVATTTPPQTNGTSTTTTISISQTNGTSSPILQVKKTKRKRPIEYIEDDILDVEQQIIKLKKRKKELENELIEAKEELKAKHLKKKLKQYEFNE
ncbi:6679_t:CDS:2 [Cetraspora pellucida]|uniref:6679_t:CDS:1 n=1 Tax=Cetraspora pellucida TaxID=1433469 RepID=A0A9N9PIG2_9GLOM|nr:6679_t:CDS:2 [Cetraspora pellucida]